MNVPLWRQIVPCLAVFLSVAGISAPAWSEASDSQFLVNQWIRQGDDGSIKGKLILPQADGSASAVNPAVVALMSDRNEMKSVETDDRGAFRFEGVESGVYTLMTRGPRDVCSVVALHVISATDERAADLPQDVELAVGKIKFSSINTMMIRYLPPRQSQSAAGAPLDVNVQALPPMVASPSVHRIAQTDGGMVGQIFGAGASENRLNPSSQTNIFLFQHGEEVQRVVSDHAGAFEVQSLDPGIYSALVIGASGMGLVGFELVTELNHAVTGVAKETSLVQVQESGVATQFVMQVADGGAVVDTFQEMGAVPGQPGDVVVEEVVVVEEIADTGFGVPMGGGGFAGGGTGGGGGGGIGGGRGLGLLAIGGLAAGIVALATDDDAEPEVATPASL